MCAGLVPGSAADALKVTHGRPPCALVSFGIGGPRGSPEASACPRYALAVPMCNAGDVAMTGVQTSLSLIDVFMMQR